MGLKINLLEYLRSKTDVDIDSLDLKVAKTLGPFVDCTSNQADCYFEFLKPERQELLKESIATAREIQDDFPNVTLVELAVELCMTSVTLTVVPFITGAIHVMANPKLSYSTADIVANAKRISNLCKRWSPDFDQSRLIIKVPATWEGLQACRELKAAGILTLATTLFTIEQSILAAEAGCVSVAPFVHELRVHFDETYTDADPILPVCVQAQKYFEKYSYTTYVKAASLVNVEEVLQLAGVAAVTLAPNLLEALDTTEQPTSVLDASFFFGSSATRDSVLEKRTFIDDEAKFQKAFSLSDGGKGKLKTDEAIELFSEFQTKVEEIIKAIL